MQGQNISNSLKRALIPVKVLDGQHTLQKTLKCSLAVLITISRNGRMTSLTIPFKKRGIVHSLSILEIISGIPVLIAPKEIAV